LDSGVEGLVVRSTLQQRGRPFSCMQRSPPSSAASSCFCFRRVLRNGFAIAQDDIFMKGLQVSLAHFGAFRFFLRDYSVWRSLFIPRKRNSAVNVVA